MSCLDSTGHLDMDSSYYETMSADSPIGRPAQQAEVAPAYVFLASNDASYISGEIIAVTGGVPT